MNFLKLFLLCLVPFLVFGEDAISDIKYDVDTKLFSVVKTENPTDTIYFKDYKLSSDYKYT